MGAADDWMITQCQADAVCLAGVSLNAIKSPKYEWTDLLSLEGAIMEAYPETGLSFWASELAAGREELLGPILAEAWRFAWTMRHHIHSDDRGPELPEFEVTSGDKRFRVGRYVAAQLQFSALTHLEPAYCIRISSCCPVTLSFLFLRSPGPAGFLPPRYEMPRLITYCWETERLHHVLVHKLLKQSNDYVGRALRLYDVPLGDVVSVAGSLLAGANLDEVKSAMK